MNCKRDPLPFSLDPLGKNFVLSKPLQRGSYDPKELDKLEQENRLLITRKRDGWKLIVVKYCNKIKIYTDGGNEVTDKLPNVAWELRRLTLPNRTILVGEGIVENAGGGDDFSKANSVFHMKRKTERDLWNEIDKIRLVLFDVVLLGGKAVCTQAPYFARLSFLKTKIEWLFNWRNSRRRMRRGLMPKHENRQRRYISVVECLATTLEEAKKMVASEKWEGLVLYDNQFRLSFRLDGKNPERPTGCYKWKPIYEDDFIVRTWNRSESDRNRLKDVNMLQIDPTTGKEFNCGKLGGFSGEMRRKLKRTKKPLVIMVQYEHRFPSGKLRNARFMRIRDDKKIEACIASKSYNPT